MLTVAIVLFAVAAVGGLVLAALHLQGKDAPVGLAVVHGLAAAIALVLLIVEVVGGTVGGLAKTSIVLFVIAALGGFYLFARHLKGQQLPKGLIVLHALLAVVGFGLLLYQVYV